MEYKISKTATLYGRVSIGKGTVIEDNVILGSSQDGELIIGRDSIVRSGSIIYSGVKIGNSFKSGHNVVIRANTEIGDDVLVGTNAVVDGDCRIGNSVRIQTGAYITRYTTIEDDVFMGPLCVTTNDKYMKYGTELRGPVIRRGAKVGANSTILAGVTVGQKSIVGAGAVVTRDVEDNDVVIGNPARSLRGSKDA